MPSKPTPAQLRVLRAAREGSIYHVDPIGRGRPYSCIRRYKADPERKVTRAANACVSRGWIEIESHTEGAWRFETSSVTLTPSGRQALADAEGCYCATLPGQPRFNSCGVCKAEEAR